jgi:hypothetical protein
LIFFIMYIFHNWSILNKNTIHRSSVNLITFLFRIFTFPHPNVLRFLYNLTTIHRPRLNLVNIPSMVPELYPCLFYLEAGWEDLSCKSYGHIIHLKFGFSFSSSNNMRVSLWINHINIFHLRESKNSKKKCNQIYTWPVDCGQTPFLINFKSFE